MSDNTGIMSNRTLLQKADLALSELTSDGGLLQPAQAAKFIKVMIKESVLMKLATVVPMKSPKQLVEKIRFGSRILRAGEEGTPLPNADRSKPDLSKIELDAKLFKAEVRLNNEVLEDSIERGELRQTIMQMMGERIAVDIEEVGVQGDTTSSDTFLAQFDGVLKQATSNIVAAGTVPLTKGVFRDMLKTMPSEFLRNKKQLKFFTSVDAELDYRDSLSDRQTPAGDKNLEQDAPIAYSGMQVMSVPLFPENLGVGTNETDVLLTDPKNVNFGIWRNIRFETDKDIQAGVMIIVATLRIDVKFAHEPAVVKATGVKVAA